MKSIESSGATREEAIQNGLRELGVALHEIDRIDVIDEGSKGFLGIGKRPVRVRLTLEHVPSKARKEGNRREGGQDQQQARPQQRHSHKPSADQKPADGKIGGVQQRERGETPAGSGAKKEKPREHDKPLVAKEGQQQGIKKKRRRERGRNNKKVQNRPVQRHKSEQATGSSSETPRNDSAKNNTVKTLSEEALIAQQLAEQFSAIDEDTLTVELEALPQDAKEEEPFETITDEQGKEAAALLKEIITLMGMEATVSFVRREEIGACLVIDSKDDAKLLIGKRGATLEALQYLINRMISFNGGNENSERIIVDVGDYVRKRYAMLRDMAKNMARRAKETRRIVKLKPLRPQERRIIHLTLEKDPLVRTYSTGDSLYRNVIINPVNARRSGSHPKPKHSGKNNHSGDANSVSIEG